MLKRVARLLGPSLGGFLLGYFGLRLAGYGHAALLPFVAGFIVTTAASWCSYYLGRALLLRELRASGLRQMLRVALSAPASASDLDLLGEIVDLRRAAERTPAPPKEPR